MPFWDKKTCRLAKRPQNLSNQNPTKKKLVKLFLKPVSLKDTKDAKENAIKISR